MYLNIYGNDCKHEAIKRKKNKTSAQKDLSPEFCGCKTKYGDAKARKMGRKRASVKEPAKWLMRASDSGLDTVRGGLCPMGRNVAEPVGICSRNEQLAYSHDLL